MRRWPLSRRTTVSIGALAVSLVLVGFGALKTHDVCVEDADELAELLGFPPYETIEEYELVIDATFSGTTRRGERLYSTYDRNAPGGGKRACPT